MPIRAKLVIVVFVFAILPMFLLWGRWQGTAVGIITQLLQTDANNRAREISEQLELNLQDHQQRLTQLAQQPVLRSFGTSLGLANQAKPDNQLRVELSAFLLSYQQQYAALLGLNRAGQTLFKLETQPGANGVLQPYFGDQGFTAEDTLNPALAQNLDQLTGAQISEIEESPNGAYLWLITPLRNAADNNVTGALAAKLRVNQLLREAAGPPGTPVTGAAQSTRLTWRESLIVSPLGTVLYAAEPSATGQPFSAAFPAMQKPFTQMLRDGIEDKQFDDWIMHQRPHETVPKLSIIILERYDQAIIGLERESALMLLITTLLAVVAALTVYYLISTITNSIRRVTFGAKAIASGQLDHQIVVQTNDETRVLAHAFNRMAAKLREMLKKEGEQKQFESFARLSSVLTHDLKNQILSLSLLVNNMEKKFHREGFREDAMRTLSDAVENLTNLVAKLSDPRTPTKRVREQSDLTHLVERVLQRTAKQATGKYNLTAKLTPNVSATVDGKAIERVIENLVINALEAMPDGGNLFVLTTTENNHAVISVADTGKGMTEDFMRTRLFHPFATTKKKGIGLGLYSCRDIIEQHGGRIDVNSQLEVGTEFRVVLPLKADEAKASERQTAAV
jgi:signal transduction histidine kinase